ncbi:MAG: 50S ribosomal protein L11 methyltransferase [Arenicella sp.]
MDWQRIQFRVDASHFDDLSNILEACLAQSVTIENAGEADFFEVAFPGRPDWQKIQVTGLFYADADATAIIDFVNQTLFPDQPVPAIVERLQDQDWERVWLDQFKPFHIAADLWVCPSWITPPEKDAKNIILDPGLAFGTGTHATTFLCLQWLATNPIAGASILDYGAGSGILAIAGVLHGADKAIAVDIDPLAVAAAKENAQRNEVADKMTSLLVTDLVQEQCYDLVIANILADVLIEHAGILASSVVAGGTLLLSGLLSEQREKVEKSFADQFVFQHYVHEGWVLLVGVKAS